jgi:hypothetical protein
VGDQQLKLEGAGPGEEVGPPHRLGGRMPEAPQDVGGAARAGDGDDADRETVPLGPREVEESPVRWLGLGVGQARCRRSCRIAQIA